MKKICQLCGKSFDAKKQITKFCSRVCYLKSCSTWVYKICEICGDEFQSKYNKRKFCSQKCYFQYRKGMPLKKKGSLKICISCGKEFYVHPFREKTAKYCSDLCKGKVELGKRIKKRILICKFCGHKFEHFGLMTKKYCSNKCRYKSRKSDPSNKKTLSCVKCGKEFKVWKSQSYKRKYCSKKCRDKDIRDAVKQITKRNGVRRYFERRGLIKKCEDCGYNKHPEILGIHHIDFNGKNHSFNNLIVLCPNCHALRHKHFINH